MKLRLCDHKDLEAATALCEICVTELCTAVLSTDIAADAPPGSVN